LAEGGVRGYGGAACRLDDFFGSDGEKIAVCRVNYPTLATTSSTCENSRQLNSPFSPELFPPEKGGFCCMKLVPVGEHVVVKRLEAEHKTAGGIVLPDSAREKPHQGRVLSIGDGRRNKDGSRNASQVSEGDRILFSPWSGTEVEVDGEKLLIMTEQDILAVLD
jgi:chaperonin GroES